MLFWIALFTCLGLTVLYYSRHQPYPEISGRFALVLLVTGAILWLSTTAPRATGESVPAVVATIIGGAAVVIGAIAAPIMMASLMLIERVFKIDDPVGAISVHGVTGLWGLLAVGIFANGNNGVEGLVVGEGKQIISQLISMGVVLAWGLVTGFALFMLLKVTMGVRATETEELEGLDISEHGLPAHGDD